MNNHPAPEKLDPELLHLVKACCNGLCCEKDFEELQQRLQSDADARLYYLRYMNVDSALQAYGEVPGHVWESQAAGRDRFLTRLNSWQRAVLLAASALVVLGAFLFIPENENQQRIDRPASVIARLQQVDEQTRVTGKDGVVRVPTEGSELNVGETVHTHGSLSSVQLIYPDQSSLTLLGQTTLTCMESDYKELYLQKGTLFASVSSQPEGRPMHVTTPTSSLEVLGTRFTVDASESEADMSVAEGRVRLTRLSDGKSVEVPTGRRVVSNEASELALLEIPRAPDEWSEDFENAFPERWGDGVFVSSKLPAESNGAVQAKRVPGQFTDIFNIATQQQWTHGLFTVHEETHLHLTLKMRDPGFFNILVLTKSADTNPPTFAGNYIFDEPIWLNEWADKWGTLTIPLSKFRPLSSSPEAFENVIPFQIVLSSPDRDRGLVVDRISVTRGGPGLIETSLLKSP